MRTRLGVMGAMVVAAGCAAAAAYAALASTLVASASAGSVGTTANTTTPRRIVSINLCTDQLLLDLVERERIVAVSQLAADPALSAVTERVGGLTLVRGSAEEVLALAPDLVLTSEYSTPQLVALLRRLGVRVETIPLASDIDGIRRAVKSVAASVGEEARGREAIAAFDARIAALSVSGARRPSALAYQVNSLTAGPGGLIDAMMTAAGLRNMADEHRLGPAGRLPLEAFVARPPDLVVLATPPDAYATRTADNLRHPAMRALMQRRPSAEVGMPLWLCGTPAVADGVELLAQARKRIQATAAAAAAGDGRAPSPSRGGRRTLVP